MTLDNREVFYGLCIGGPSAGKYMRSKSPYLRVHYPWAITRPIERITQQTVRIHEYVYDIIRTRDPKSHHEREFAFWRSPDAGIDDVIALLMNVYATTQASKD